MTLNDSTGSDSVVIDARRMHRILLIDAHRILREAVRLLVDASDEFEVVGEAGGATEALQLIDSLQPDVVLTDLSLPDRAGTQFIAEFHSRLPQLEILVLTALQTREHVAAALKAGARGYILKNCGREELFAAIREIAAGRQHLCKSLEDSEPPARVRKERKRAGMPTTNITERQRQVVRSVALGYRNKDIAQRLGVSESAIRKHRERLSDALELRGTAALTLYAVREGLVCEGTGTGAAE
jgi:DNA-binding NarL/FixJ family response regulator